MKNNAVVDKNKDDFDSLCMKLLGLSYHSIQKVSDTMFADGCKVSPQISIIFP